MAFHIFNVHAIRSGASDPSWCDEVVNVMRPSALGNPFPIGRGPGRSRAKVIEQFGWWLWDEIRKPESLARAEIERLAWLCREGKDIALVCCCSPLPCHAEVVARAAEYLGGLSACDDVVVARR